MAHAVGRSLLAEYRASLELLRLELAADAPVYAPVLEAVGATLPGPSPATRAEAMALAGPPPAEQVGLEPFDPRLLPLTTVAAGSTVVERSAAESKPALREGAR